MRIHYILPKNVVNLSSINIVVKSFEEKLVKSCLQIELIYDYHVICFTQFIGLGNLLLLHQCKTVLFVSNKLFSNLSVLLCNYHV